MPLPSQEAQSFVFGGPLCLGHWSRLPLIASPCLGLISSGVEISISESVPGASNFLTQATLTMGMNDLFPYAVGILLCFGFCSKEDSGAEKENTSVLQHNPSLSGSRNGEENIIDNPYLRPVKKPKIRRKK